MRDNTNEQEKSELLSRVSEQAEQEKGKSEFEEAQERLAHYKARAGMLQTQVSNLLADRGKFRDLVDQVVQAVVAAEPWKRDKAISIPKHSGSPIDAVLMLSDLHIGEVVNPKEIEDFNEFNWEIAQSRMFQLSSKLAEWIEMHRHVFKIPRLHVFGLGDYISGNIHQELLVTNEFPLPVQTANAGLLIGETVSRLATSFPEVVFWEQGADNHSRLQPKPQAKQKQRNSMSYLVHVIMEQYLRQHTNVRFERTEGMKMLAEVNGWRFLLEHGDMMRGVLGIPFYGMQRTKGKEAVKRMRTGKEFDYMAIGHWHVPSKIDGNIYVNGSLSGTTEYDASQGRFAHPAQVSFLVHPRHGIFNETGWRFKK